MTDANIVCCVGLQRTGKTHHLDWMLERVHAAEPGLHAIVIDGNGEWPLRPLKRKAVKCHSMQAALTEVRDNQLVLWQPPSPPEQEDVAALAEAVRGDGRLLVVPEVHRYIPSGRMAHVPTALSDIVLASRHKNVRTALWGDTQYFSNVHAQFIASGTCHVFGQTARADLERLRQMIGDSEIVDLVKECARRASAPEFGGLGQPGWHVTIDPLNRLPGSFRLRRTTS